MAEDKKKTTSNGKRKWVGSSYKRKEDLRLLTGRGRFMDDIRLPNTKYAAILRSPYAHAIISDVDISEALKAPGMIGVVTGKDVKEMSKPYPCGVPIPPKYYVCAVDRVRYVGEPVAVVVAENRYLAEDALDLIEVDYEPLEAVVDIEKALEPDAPVLHDNIGSNIYNHRFFKYGDWESACKEADEIVKWKFNFPKYAGSPMETYAVIASYNPFEKSYVIYNNYQGPFVNHALTAMALGVPENKMRWIIPADIGGGFGTKTGLYPYCALIAITAKKTGVTVKWIEDRREHLLASATCTDRVTYIEAAVRKDGKILGLKDKAMDTSGGYIRPPEPGCAYRSTGNHTGAYDIRNLDREVYVIATNKGLTAPLRGYGCQELYFSTERITDMAAAKLGIDPAEMRFKNLIQPEQMPYETATGGYYDVGNYPAAFKKCLDLVEYDKMREYQKKAREEGRLVGIGLATVVDPSVTNIAYVAIGKTIEERKNERDKSGSGEAAIVKVDPLGGITVICSTNPQGQGHDTVISQIIADEFGVHPDQVTVDNELDSSDRLYTITTGSFSSRFASQGTTAVVKAARNCLEKAKKIAAHLLKIEQANVVLEDGKFFPMGKPESAILLRHIAGAAHWNQSDLPEGMDVGLYGTSMQSMPTSRPPDDKDRVNSSNTYGFVAEAIVVEVDPDTGQVRFLKWASVHDAGKILNPEIVRGQVLGSIVQAIGGSLYEEQAYDENGQCLTASFADYLCPTAMEMPKIDVGHFESQSVLTALGSKGCGESSSMSVPPAIGNAIADALAPLGAVVDKLPLSPSNIWHLMEEAKAKKS